MRDLLARAKSVLILRGVLSALFGVLLLLLTSANPIMSAATLLMVFGIMIIVYGLYAVVISFGIKQYSDDWWIVLVEGILGMLLGVMTLLWPGAAAMVIAIWMACWFMVIGLMTVFQAIELRKEIKGEGWYIVSGLLAFLVGVMMIANPGAVVIVSIYAISFLAILYGVIMFIVAGKAGDIKKKLDDMTK